MAETIEHLLLSPQSTSIMIFLIAILVIVIMLSKNGILQVHTASVQIGAADRERNIIRQQLDWVRSHLLGLESELEKPDDYNAYLGKYIVECVYDAYVDWITFNHISSAPAYIKIKQDKVVSIVKSLAIKEQYKSSEFEEFLRRDTEECIKSLLQIREVYK